MRFEVEPANRNQDEVATGPVREEQDHSPCEGEAEQGQDDADADLEPSPSASDPVACSLLLVHAVLH